MCAWFLNCILKNVTLQAHAFEDKINLWFKLLTGKIH